MQKNINYVLLLFLVFLFLLDEFTFILYNLSFFQFLCSNTVGFFLTNEVPVQFIEWDPSYLIYSFELKEQQPMSMITSLSMDDGSLMNYEWMKQTNQTSHTNSLVMSKLNDSMEEQQDTLFYKVRLEATNAKKNVASFYPLNNYVYTVPGEASLIFYRFENLTDHFINSISVYVTLPSEAINHITKIQCFCYEELMVAPNEVVDLPILFMVEPSILNEYYNEITINYILLIKDEKYQ